MARSWRLGTAFLAKALTILLLVTPSGAASLIESHSLSVRLYPKQRRIEARDRLELRSPGASLELLVHKGLTIKEIRAEPSGERLSFRLLPGADHRKRLIISLGGFFESPEAVTITYEGTIYDPVRKAQTLAFLRGDETTGLIGPEGIFLTQSTGWYPSSPKEGLSRFEIEVSVPEPFRAVTQGRLLGRKLKEGLWTSRWLGEAPAEGLTLIAAPFRIYSRKAGRVTLSVYFLKGSRELAEKYLDAAQRYMAFYGELLGPYPYSRFDIVENFFSSGLGLAGFTLLGPGVIAQGERALRPGYLDHEIVHSWWGNYVYHRPGPGNWAEALTTYLANYLWRERNEGPEEARAWRRRTIQKYAIRVSPDKDYALKEFATKLQEHENDIGYGKGAMVFHMLRRQVGEEAFWRALRKMVRRFGGRYASWSDFQRSFEAESGQDLSWFFHQWLNQPGGPRLALKDVSVKSTSQGFSVEGILAQEGGPYRLQVTLRLDAGQDSLEQAIELSGPSASFSFQTRSLPRALSIDPEGHVFRLIGPEEIIPGLNALLEDRPALLVVPKEGKDPSWAVYWQLAQRASARKGALVATPEEVKQEDLKSRSVLLFGNLYRMGRFRPLLQGLPSWVGIRKKAFYVKEEVFGEPTDSILVVGRNPLNPKHFVGIFRGLKKEALSRARLLFFYGWDGLVVFRSGRPILRADFEPRQSRARRGLGLELARSITREALMEHVRVLADPLLKGRFPGTPGDRKAARYIQRHLEASGFEPVVDVGKTLSWLQPFTLTLPDIGFFNLRLKADGREVDVEGWPMVGSPEGRYRAPLIEAGYGLSEPERDDYAGKAVFGKAVLVRDGLPEATGEEDRLEILQSKIDAAAERQAAVLLVALSGPMPKEYVALSAYPSLPSPGLRDHVRRLKAKGQFSSLAMEIMKLQSRSQALEAPALPVVFVTGAERWPKDGEIELNLHYRRRRWPTQNVVGYLVGSDPFLRREIVILGAHYDGLGPGPRGELFLGADDNASGVAALLEVSRLLARQRQWLRRSLLVIAFGAEEWGQVGSRYYLAHPARDLARSVAFINADAIAGRSEAASVYLIGRSRYPKLAARAEPLASEVGLAVGRDIDQYAFRYGSDFWPFHRAGIPVLGLWASNYERMNTARDTLAHLDEAKLEAVARLLYLTALELLTSTEPQSYEQGQLE